MSEGLVKSAARALDILEAFASKREPMTASEIGAALGYPKSSLSMLLRSLVNQGYLTLGGTNQSYFPTLKVARLGDWVTGALIGSEHLLAALAELRVATAETVTLTGPLDLQMRCLHALIGTHPIALQVEEGVRFPMMGTAVGVAWLAAHPAASVAEYLARWSKQNGTSEIERQRVIEAIEIARSRNYAAVYDAVIPDTGAVAVPIVAGSDEILVVAVAGLNRRIRDAEQSIVGEMTRLLAPFRFTHDGAEPRE